MTTNTKTQQRAICPACFAQQAVRNGRLVQHGYTRPQAWHSNVNTCSGTGHQHFGTIAGRDFTASLAASLRTNAHDENEHAQRVLDGQAAVWGQKRMNFKWVPVEIEHPTPLERNNYALQVQAKAKHLLAAAVELEGIVARWSPAEPITVTVEKTQTLLHWRRNDRWGGKACARSAMAADKGYMTGDLARVTCEKCKLTAARLAARTSSVK